MEKKRELAEGWHEGWIKTRCYTDVNDGDGEPVSLPIICQNLGAVVGGDCADNEWFPAHAAPDRCLKPAEPDSGAPELKVGERVYVDAPEAGGFDRMIGWGIITSRPALDHNKVCVAFDDKFTHPVPRAACHREGPQAEPPNPEAVFLGRFPYPGLWSPLDDVWWHQDHIVFSGGPRTGAMAKYVHGRTNSYSPPLAVARALRLVEAEKGEPAPEPERQTRIVCDGCGAEGFDSQLGTNHVIHNNPTDPPELCGHYVEVPVEPERPEPNFMLGQWGKHPVGLAFTRFCIDARWWDSEEYEWWYSGLTANGSHTETGEEYLEPCAPVLTPEQEALRPGDEVESIEILVGPDGVPVYLPLTALDAPTEIDTVLLPRSGDKMAQFASGRREWLWNLRLVRKADA